jgi:hypothetical protein
MEFSTDTEKFLLNSRESYYKFQKHQTPFAAVKINFSGLGGERAKVDDIVRNNFRSEKDAIKGLYWWWIRLAPIIYFMNSPKKIYLI